MKGKYHSTVTRRDFMKALGLGAAGLGAAAATGPVLHDLDELLSTGGSTPRVAEKRPWWVKEREYLNPVSEIDWNVMENFKGLYNNNSAHLETEERLRRNALRLETRANYFATNAPGNTRRDYALRVASWSGNADPRKRVQASGTGLNPAFLGSTSGYILGDGMHTQMTAGLPRWEGTPEENNQMVRAACRFFGGGATAFGENIDGKTKKLTFGKPGRGYPMDSFQFEDVDEPYQIPFEANVIPNSYRYLILTNIMQPLNHGRTSPSGLMEASVGKGYDQCRITGYRLVAFLKALGWGGVTNDQPGMTMRPGWAEIAGLGEVGRIAAQVITPECGPGIRMTLDCFTNLPLAPTNPIDFGASRFCLSCTKCADACPGTALPYGDKTWDMVSADAPNMNPDHLRPELFNQPGKKTFWLNHFACHEAWVGLDNGCNVCTAVCVFARELFGSVHELVKPIVAKTTLFNGFFFSMDKAFGYGVLPEDNWEDFWSYPELIAADNY